MEIRITIDDHLIGRLKRALSRWRVAALVLMLGVVSGVAVVHAVDSTPPNTFATGTVISSTDVNENFGTIYAAVSALEDDVTALQDSVAAAITVTAYGIVFINEAGSSCNLGVGSVQSDNVLSATFTAGINGCDVSFDGLTFDHNDHIVMLTPIGDGTAAATSSGGNLRILLSGADNVLVHFLVIDPS